MSVYGIRLFQEFGGRVYSPLFTGFQWNSDIQQATCENILGKYMRLNSTHAVPNDDCRCGFYANWTLKAMFESANSDMANAVLGYNFLGIGLVEAFGKIIVHERGFKSEYMQIIGFLRATAKTDGLRSADIGRKLFGFPIITVAHSKMSLDLDMDYGIRCARAIGVRMFDIESAENLLLQTVIP